MGAHLTGFVQDALLLVVDEKDVGARLSQAFEDVQVAPCGGQVKWCALLQVVVTRVPDVKEAQEGPPQFTRFLMAFTEL